MAWYEVHCGAGQPWSKGILGRSEQPASNLSATPLQNVLVGLKLVLLTGSSKSNDIADKVFSLLSILAPVTVEVEDENTSISLIPNVAEPVLVLDLEPLLLFAVAIDVDVESEESGGSEVTWPKGSCVKEPSSEAESEDDYQKLCDDYA